MTESREPIGVIGVGWVGLVTAACFAELGHPVVARDIVAEKVEALSRGEVTIHEPGLAELLARNAERLTFTTEMAELLDAARLLFVCVDTPPTPSGDADLSRVRAVVEELRADGGHVLVMKSTVPAGTGADDPARPARRRLRLLPRVPQGGLGGRRLHAPRPGRDRRRPGRRGRPATPSPRSIEPLGGEIVRTDVASAEMIKLASNAFLATKISFVNEIANVCEEVGADVGEVARGMGLDQRIGPSFLRAGIGYGGSCFPKDVSALKMLAGNTGYHFQLLNAVIEVNELQKRRVVRKLLEARSARWSASAWRCSASPSSRTPTTCARRRAWCWRRGCRARGPRCRRMTRWPPRRRASCSTRRAARLGARGARRRRRGRPGHRVGRVRRARLGRRGRAGWPRPLLVDGRNFLDPKELRRSGLRVRGDRNVGRGRALARRPPTERMQAIVLVGGEGTRLRPLTETVPKPALTLVDRPFLAYMIEWLAGHGVTEVVLACGFLPDVLRGGAGR